MKFWSPLILRNIKFSNFDPIINLIFALLLNWLKLKLKFSGYRILNRWLSYNSQTQVDSTVFIKKQFCHVPVGYRIVHLGPFRIIVSVLHLNRAHAPLML